MAGEAASTRRVCYASIASGEATPAPSSAPDSDHEDTPRWLPSTLRGVTLRLFLHKHLREAWYQNDAVVDHLAEEN